MRTIRRLGAGAEDADSMGALAVDKLMPLALVFALSLPCVLLISKMHGAQLSLRWRCP
jgi:hypothetical protein